MSPKLQEFQELETRWKERSAEARRTLELATGHLHEVERDIKSGSTEEGGYRYRQAVQEETAALIEYAKVLRIYADLVAHGKMPDENLAPQPSGFSGGDYNHRESGGSGRSQG